MNNSKIDKPNFSLEAKIHTGVMQLAGQYGFGEDVVMEHVEEDLTQAEKEGIPSERIKKIRKKALALTKELLSEKG